MGSMFLKKKRWFGGSFVMIVSLFSLCGQGVTVKAQSGGDTILPSPPSSISATAEVTTSPRVTISWSGASDNVGVSRYNIYRNGSFWISPSGVQTSYVDRDVVTGSTYTYSVQAGDAAGNNSNQSDTVSITVINGSTGLVTSGTTASPTEVPLVSSPSTSVTIRSTSQKVAVPEPTNVTATSTTNYITLSWKYPDLTQASSVRINRKIGSPPTSIYDGSIIYDGKGEQYSDMSGLVQGITYYYGVYAVNASYNTSQLVTVSAMLPSKQVTLGMIVPVAEAKASSSLVATTVASPSSSIQSSKASSSTFIRTLRRGSMGEDVMLLQKFLNTQGFEIAPSGPGSLGYETRVFGLATERALKRYQCSKNIVCTGSPSETGYGVFGRMTRASVNEKY